MSIYNKKYECIYINIPRTASGSISQIVRTGGPETAMNAKLNHERKLEKSEIMKSWDETFKFSFVRNPYDRLLSAYYHLRLNKLVNPNRFINEYGFGPLLLYEKAIFRPQSEYLLDDQRNIMVDFVGKFENLHEDWKKLQKKLLIKEDLTYHLHRTQENKKSWDKNAKNKIYNFYEDDFLTFGYER